MKKRISAFLLALSLLLLLSGCGNAQSHKAFTFSVDTGDKVYIELDTSDGYDITSDLPFEISKDGTVLTQGIFIEAEQFESYVEAVNTDENANVIESSTKDEIQYVFWSYNNEEFDIVILIDGSDTGILLGNTTSEESAMECFERLTISLAQ